MKLRLTPLSFWLATILLMVAGMLAPGAASAHAGHGEERGQARILAVQVSSSTASLNIQEDLANALPQGYALQAVHLATLSAQPDRESGCAGATCCGTGHGCCAAYLPGGVESPPSRTGRRLAIVLASAPPGRGAPRLPEPPRPVR